MRKQIAFIALAALGIFAIAELVQGADTAPGLYGRLHRFHRYFHSPNTGAEIDTTGSAKIRSFETFRDDTTGHGTAWTVNELADGHWTWYVDNHPTELVDVYWDSAGVVVKMEEDYKISGRTAGDSTIAASTCFLAAVVPSAALIDDACTAAKVCDTDDFIMDDLSLTGKLVTEEIQCVTTRVECKADFRADYIDTDSIAATGDVLKVIATRRLDFAADTLKAASGDAVVCVGVWDFAELHVTQPATFDDILVVEGAIGVNAPFAYDTCMVGTTALPQPSATWTEGKSCALIGDKVAVFWDGDPPTYTAGITVIPYTVGATCVGNGTITFEVSVDAKNKNAGDLDIWYVVYHRP